MSSPPSLMQTLVRRFHLLVTVTLPKSAAYHLYFLKMAKVKFAGLNLGSGGTWIKGFCNIDANPRSACDVIAHVNRIKLSSNSVGAVYSSHVFEHIPRAEAAHVLAEWHRVLKPGGTMYICVPNQEVLFRIYLDNLPVYDTAEGRRLVDRACYITYGGQTSRHDFHFYGYSFTTLKYLLESVGFKDVRRLDRSDIEISLPHDVSVAQVDSFPMSLNVRASKGVSSGNDP